MFAPDPEFQNIAMLYMPAWNGLVEGPTWGAWWIQNSYGPTYCALAVLAGTVRDVRAELARLVVRPDGRRQDGAASSNFAWVPPDGCLCDAAGPGTFHRQAGRRQRRHSRLGHGVHRRRRRDAGRTAADRAATRRPSRTICPSCGGRPISSRRRRDPKNNLFLAGPAGNLLAPSYAGWKKPDGTYDKAYLTGLSITYIAGLDRLIELEKLAGNAAQRQALQPSAATWPARACPC